MSDAIDKAFEAYCAERKRLLIEAGERTAAANMQRSPADFRAGWEAAIATPPASQKSAGEAVAQEVWAIHFSGNGGGYLNQHGWITQFDEQRAVEFCECLPEGYTPKKLLLVAASDYAALTAELAEAREQRDSLRDECERLRAQLADMTADRDTYREAYGKKTIALQVSEFKLAALSAGEKEKTSE